MVNPLVLGLILFDTLIGAVAALVIKKGTNKSSLRHLWKTPYLWGGLFLYGVSVLIYMIILPLEELTVIYPLVATSYIWATIFAVRFLGDKMNQWKYIGLVGIIIGVIFIGLGA